MSAVDPYVRRKVGEAEVLLKQGGLVSAHFAIRKALRHDPDNVSALIVAAEIALRTRKRMEAMDIVNRLFELSPGALDGARQKRLGHVCFENEQYDLAAQLFDWVRQKRQQDERALYHGGMSLRRLGRMEEAETWLRECLERRPDVADVHQQLGHVFKATGRTAEAVECYRKSIELSRDAKGQGYWCLADLKNYEFTDDDVADMQRELASTSNDAHASALRFSLGWAAEQKQDFATAMEHYREGNAIQARLKPFPAKEFRDIVAGLRGVGPEPEPLPTGDGGPVAILIVGLPRSGTTLIEQVLSAHPRVQPTDELPFLERIALRLEMHGGYPKRLAALDADERRFLRTQYINGARTYMKGDGDFFVDKYPGNFLHVGLAKRIMPEAIVIDARRDPRDIAISAYRQLFGQRGEFTSSFETIREYYEGYLAMMGHWRSVYPDGIVTQQYERLVEDPDGQIRSLLAACGLDDDPACHEFYKHRRAVTTPSASQVSQPVYTTSVGKWQSFEPYAAEELGRLGGLAAAD